MAAKAVLETLRHVWLTIRKMDIDAAVVGGIAMAAWRHPRATRAVDVMVSLSEDQLDRLITALLAANVKRKKAKHRWSNWAKST